MQAAGGVMEVFLTADFNLFGLAALREGETVLIHGGGSGVGTAAIALLRESGLRCFVTAGSDDRCARCQGLGAELAINYRSQDFVELVNQTTYGIGTNVILDCMGGGYLERNLSALAPDGRLIIIGLMGGTKAELNLQRLLSKRLRVIGSVLRSQPPENKAQLILSFRHRFGDALDQGRLHPVVDRVFPLSQVSEAHRWMESQVHFGKVILTI
jgi:NADPH:quinone reductase-like Zn-dependent oxidoreductase